MFRGPKTQKRPVDATGNAFMIVKIATGEIGGHHHGGRQERRRGARGMGGKARVEGMSAKRRKEIARKAAKSRWKAQKQIDFIFSIDILIEKMKLGRFSA
jgi:hypothetical protein